MRLPTLSCSHLRPRNLHPLSAPTPATLTWISLSARSSCRGSPLPAAQLSPENIEHGEESPHLPQCCPLYPQQPWARSEGFPFSPSPLTVTTVLKVTGWVKGRTRSPTAAPPAQLLLPAPPAACCSPTAARTHTSCSAGGDTRVAAGTESSSCPKHRQPGEPRGPPQNQRTAPPQAPAMCPAHLLTVHGSAPSTGQGSGCKGDRVPVHY